MQRNKWAQMWSRCHFSSSLASQSLSKATTNRLPVENCHQTDLLLPCLDLWARSIFDQIDSHWQVAGQIGLTALRPPSGGKTNQWTGCLLLLLLLLNLQLGIIPVKLAGVEDMSAKIFRTQWSIQQGRQQSIKNKKQKQILSEKTKSSIFCLFPSRLPPFQPTLALSCTKSPDTQQLETQLSEKHFKEKRRE